MAEGPEDRPNDRCLGFTLPCTSNYCAFSRIAQSPGGVTIYYEAGHTGGAYRTIALDRRPHLPSHIRQWYGDSVGRWEDETLVVDTTNFTDRRSVQGTSTPIGFKGNGESFHLVERFTRVASDMILYSATIENPAMYSRPWTIELPWIQADNGENQIFESACHEGELWAQRHPRGRASPREAVGLIAMFGEIGVPELLILGVVIAFLVGPRLLKAFGLWTRR